MSVYEDYDRASADYARIRTPVGLEILVGAYQTHLGSLEVARLVDVGCGAGVYLEPLSHYFGSALGLDISAGQLEQARTRCSSRSNCTFELADARELPMERGSFDAALVSLMLHHIESSPGTLEGHQRVLSELARVLRPGGVAILGVCTQQQVFDGAWYCRLMPRASEILAGRHPRIEVLTSMASDAGFYSLGSFVPVDAILQGPTYFDGRGILSQSWRNGDSIFSLLSSDELDELIARVTQMDQNGVLEGFIRKHDEVRKSIGQVTFIALQRS